MKQFGKRNINHNDKNSYWMRTKSKSSWGWSNFEFYYKSVCFVDILSLLDGELQNSDMPLSVCFDL